MTRDQTISAAARECGIDIGDPSAAAKEVSVLRRFLRLRSRRTWFGAAWSTEVCNRAVVFVWNRKNGKGARDDVRHWIDSGKKHHPTCKRGYVVDLCSGIDVIGGWVRA